MKKLLKPHKLIITGVAIGALAGFFYWQQIGCISGTCAITSTWHNSTAYGAIMGGLLFSMFQGEKKDEQ
jgi:phage shock protein E